jgi:hypothetical protein
MSARSVFLLPEEADTTPPSVSEIPPAVGEVLCGGIDDFCQTGLTDEEREQAIQRARAAMEAAYAEWEASGCFSARGRAQRLQNIMADLIRGRSAGQVERMERERGLSGR